VGRRINVVGTSGNGKPTFARALAERLRVPHVELDALNHGPNWTEASDEDFRAAVAERLDEDGWVVDGSYGRKIGDLVMRRAETVVWLDQPLPLVLWRLLRRTIRRIVRQEELWAGNRESWRGAFWGRDSLFVWTIRAHFRNQKQLPEQLGRFPGLRVYRLRRPREVERFLETSEPEVPGRRSRPPARGSRGQRWRAPGGSRPPGDGASLGG
jgi:adenylate kinase family enzyme